jgi:hypothetical protein
VKGLQDEKAVNRYLCSKGFVNVLAMLVLMALTACTTTKPVEMTPEQLQQKIINGYIIDPGDSATITTRDGTRHCCWVRSITGDSVVMGKGGDPDNNFATDYSVEVDRAEQEPIPISDIVAIEKTELTDGGKAATAAGSVAVLGGLYYLLWILPALVVAAAL